MKVLHNLHNFQLLSSHISQLDKKTEAVALLPCADIMPFYLPSNQILLQLPILFIANGFAPLAMAVFSWNFHSKVREPAIRRCAMPMLYAGSYVNNVARMEFLRLLAPLLIIAAAGNADEYLPSALIGLMNVPVVAAAGFKRNIENADLGC